MCTVTLVPCFPGIRLACNRDEQRSRPAALSPQVRRFGGRRAILPIDPVSGGTWVGVSDAGLAFVLLNVNDHDRRPLASVPAPASPFLSCKRSRGTIIPGLLQCETLSDAVQQALTVDPAEYEPFRLVLADCSEIAEIRTTGGGLEMVGRRRLIVPALFTSSGLGDHRVESPRGQRFYRCFGEPYFWLEQQDAFHRHRWPERPELSVCMSRADARTVSYTVVEVWPDVVAMTYWPDAPDRTFTAVPTVWNLPRMVTSCGPN
jgi:hypothetical protein